MTEDLYAQKLTWFKQHERPETVLMVSDYPERIKIIIAWTNLEVRRANKLTELKGESEKEVWEWLWDNIKYSQTEFIEKIGINFSEAGLASKMKPLIGNRILYPDGTVNSFVQRYLQQQVLKLFEAKPKRPAQKG